MSNSVINAAHEWIKQIEAKQKLNKQARNAVISFAIWLDGLIDLSEKEEKEKHDNEN